MNTISIIGCGWLGYPLALFLKEKNYQIKGSSRSQEKLDLLQSHQIQAFNIQVDHSLKGDHLDDFFSSEILIINIPPGRRNPNVETAHPLQIKAIVEAAKKGDVKKIIFISSTGVYGNENRVLTEDDTPHPIRPSGKALVQIEAFLQKDDSLDTTILRMAGLVGGERKAGRFFAGKKNVPNGANPINMVHRKDCIQVIYEIIRQNCWNTIFNVCADEHPSKKEFYTAQALKDGFEPPTFMKDQSSDYKIISNAKLKKHLNYTLFYPDPMKF